MYNYNCKAQYSQELFFLIMLPYAILVLQFPATEEVVWCTVCVKKITRAQTAKGKEMLSH